MMMIIINDNHDDDDNNNGDDDADDSGSYDDDLRPLFLARSHPQACPVSVKRFQLDLSGEHSLSIYFTRFYVMPMFCLCYAYVREGSKTIKGPFSRLLLLGDKTCISKS